MADRTNKIEALFAIDYRTLAFFRILISITLLLDLLERAQGLYAHYSDGGVLPRPVVEAKILSPFIISFHLMNGTWQFQALLFLVAALFALALMVGYQTKLMTFLSWIMLISLQSRNPLICNGGDNLLRLLLFWSLFLPLGARYSVDHALNTSLKKRTQRVLSPASIGILLQVAAVYLFVHIHKTGNEWWPNGTAIYYALSIEQMTTPLAKYLLLFPGLMKFLSLSLWAFQGIGPFLLFLPIFMLPLRILGLSGFFLMHIGFGVFLDLGIFPLVCIVGLTLFIPGSFWDWANLRFKKRHSSLVIYYDTKNQMMRKTALILREFLLLSQRSVRPCHKTDSAENNFRQKNLSKIFRGSPLSGILPILKMKVFAKLSSLGLSRILKNENISSRLSWGLPFRDLSYGPSLVNRSLSLFFIGYILFVNLETLAIPFEIPKTYRWISPLLRVDQDWNMFAPYPMKDDGWYVISGRLKNGTVLNPLKPSEQPLIWNRPKSLAYDTVRWQKYMMNLWKNENTDYRGFYAKYLCRIWNNSHDEPESKLTDLEIFFMLKRTPPQGEKVNVSRVSIWKQKC